MPEIGEIKRGSEIGLSYYNEFIWHACIDCDRERWLQLQSTRRGNYTGRCHHCNGKNGAGITGIAGKYGKSSGCWRGGRIRVRAGYIQIKLTQDDFYFPMAKEDRYVREHRLVMAKHLGRILKDSEVVHHINKDTADNRIDNLLLYASNGAHISKHKKIKEAGNGSK